METPENLPLSQTLGHMDLIVGEPLDHREWAKLRAQFRQMIPVGPNHWRHGRDIADPECHGYGENWSYARYSVGARKKPNVGG